jgi:hypothetical protein
MGFTFSEAGLPAVLRVGTLSLGWDDLGRDLSAPHDLKSVVPQLFLNCGLLGVGDFSLGGGC